MKLAKICLASYPRSGSKWLRFLLCNVAHPLSGGHDFGTVDYYFPRDEPGSLSRSFSPRWFFATHERPEMVTGQASFYIYLHRHVGDVLISNYHYHKQSLNYTGSLQEYIKENGFGLHWRFHIDSLIANPDPFFLISYDEIGRLSSIETLLEYIGFSPEDAEQAIELSAFDTMVKSDRGKRHHCRVGTSNQWKELPKSLQDQIIQANKKQLDWLKYRK